MGCLSIAGLPPALNFAGTHLNTWVEKCAVRVKCLVHEHNTMSPSRARTRTARSGVESTNHEAIAPPRHNVRLSVISWNLWHWSNFGARLWAIIDFFFFHGCYAIQYFICRQKILVMQRSRVVYHGISHASLVFSRHTHLPKGSCVYRETTSDAWDIPWYSTRKCCITILSHAVSEAYAQTLFWIAFNWLSTDLDVLETLPRKIPLKKSLFLNLWHKLLETTFERNWKYIDHFQK